MILTQSTQREQSLHEYRYENSVCNLNFVLKYTELFTTYKQIQYIIIYL